MPIHWSFVTQFHPVLMGDISTSGNFTALYVHQFTKAWRLKLNMQVRRHTHT